MTDTTLPTVASRPIRFFHRGKVVEVRDAAPTRTVLDWLREDRRSVGTKEGCNEGDCGACTVVVGEPAGPDDRDAIRGLRLRPANACIRFLPTLDGCALYTVEDLKGVAAEGSDGAPPAGLHPVQQALVDCHGSQCGFCTPGFVMSLWATYERCGASGRAPTRQQLADELSGNLCRCTGYRPILDAGERMFELPARRLDTAPVLAALGRLRAEADLVHVGPAPAMVASAPPAGLIPAAGTSEPTEVRPALPARFYAPTSLEAFAALRASLPEARILAGSTDIGVWVNKQFRPLGDILYLGRVDALQRIEVEPEALGAGAGALSIGAGASLEAAFAAIVTRAPTLEDAWLRFASPPIRHAGTLGGNVANGSPIGDAPPCLLALDAELELRRGDRTRRLPLADFYLDYMKNRLESGEFLQRILVPLAAFDRKVRGYKISKRFDSDISAVFGGFAVELDGEKVGAVRLAFGGMAAIARRSAAAEAVLLGRPWNQDSVDAAKAALAADFRPLSDMRASAGYRLQVAQNLLQRFWLETRPTDPLPAEATSVYAAMPHRGPTLVEVTG